MKARYVALALAVLFAISLLGNLMMMAQASTSIPAGSYYYLQNNQTVVQFEDAHTFDSFLVTNSSVNFDSWFVSYNSTGRHYQLSFDGVSNYVGVSFTLPATFTEMLFFKRLGSGGGGVPKLFYWSGYAADLGVGNTAIPNKLGFFIRWSDGTDTGWHGVADIVNGVFYCAALSWDGTWVRVHSNGDLIYSSNAWAGKTLQSSTSFHIGGGADYFDGLIPLVFFYNRTLSDDEIQQNNAHPDQPITDGLVLNLTPDSINATAGIWNDTSGNGNDGTIHGATAELTHLQFPWKDNYVEVKDVSSDALTLTAYAPTNSTSFTTVGFTSGQPAYVDFIASGAVARVWGSQFYTDWDDFIGNVTAPAVFINLDEGYITLKAEHHSTVTESIYLSGANSGLGPSGGVLQHSFLSYVLGPYIDLMGPMFFGVVYFAFMGAIFIRTKSAVLVAALMLVTLPVALYALPKETHVYIYITIALAISTLVFTLVKGRYHD